MITALRNRIRDPFINDLTISFLTSVAQTRVCSSTTRPVVCKELKLHAYKPQMRAALTKITKQVDLIRSRLPYGAE